MFNPIRFLKNLFVDFLILVSGTYIGSPNSPDSDTQSSPEQNDTPAD